MFLKLRVVRIFDKVTKYFFNPKIYYTKLRVSSVKLQQKRRLRHFCVISSYSLKRDAQ